MKILVATNNKGKRSEIEALFKGLKIDLLFPNQLNINAEVEESGSTYAENAALKAETLCRISGLPTIADDTGLEVEALEGRPGLHSARYHPDPLATDADRRARMLDELKEKPAPWRARFVCVVAYARTNLPTLFFEGELRGEIIPHESGDFGSGYDRLFWVAELQKTLAELNMAEKNELSHRARAINRLKEYLEK